MLIPTYFSTDLPSPGYDTRFRRFYFQERNPDFSLIDPSNRDPLAIGVERKSPIQNKKKKNTDTQDSRRRLTGARPDSDFLLPSP